MLDERSLDLAKLDTMVTADLHLVIEPAQKLQIAIRQIANQIPGPVLQPITIPKRRWHKTLCRQTRPLPISSRQTCSANVKLA